jgi:phosphodiesterase/alkaline phosphatase D-like protein
LTAEAVKRFQRRHGFEQVGFVGPKTLRKLNELLQEHPLALEDRDDEDEDEDEGRMKDVQKQNKKTAKALGEVFGKEVCAIVPPGHLIAPGWLKKHGKPLIPPCQVLPPGIAAKLGITVPAPTSTPDTAAPAIGGVAAQNLTANSAVIVWSTNEPATSKVYYGTISPLNLATASMTSQSALVTSHSVPLTGLNASTTYHYVVESKDGPGNTATSSPQSFTTASQVDATAPSVTSQSVTPATSSATVSWTTNELADSQIFYGTSVAYGSSTALDATLATVHSQTISGLTPNTRYFYQVRSKDASQNLGTQAGEFTTLPPADTAAPLISGVAATLVGSSTATIIWTTDEAATSKVYYGTLLPLDLATAAFTTTSGLGMNHSVPLSGLNASSTYYYAVESKDAANNTAVSATSSQQFTTTP